MIWAKNSDALCLLVVFYLRSHHMKTLKKQQFHNFLICAWLLFRGVKYHSVVLDILKHNLQAR